MSKEENPIVYCDAYDCKYWDGGERCTRESIIITGPGQFPTCDSFEPDEEDESDVSKPNNDGERELLDRAVKALEAELATKTCNKQIASKLEDAELARDSEETCNNKQVISKLVASEDTISRQAAIEEIRFGQSFITKIHPTGEIEHLFDKENKALEAAVERIEAMPSVTPKQRTGRWINTGFFLYDGYKCSECFYTNDGKKTNYCPNCGAKMVEPQESEG